MSDRCATAELLDEAIRLIHEVRVMSKHYTSTRLALDAFAKRVKKYESGDRVAPRYECEDSE